MAEDSGWLRAAVFGGMDGLTTSGALVIGLASSGISTAAIISASLLDAGVTYWTTRSWWFGGLRQLIIGAIAAGVTFVLGAYLS